MDAIPSYARVGEGQSRLNPSTYPFDKYPDTPQLDAGGTVVVMDEDGPGVISCFHVSDYLQKNAEFRDWELPAAARLILRVWYDREERPSIEMPYMDFLADIGHGSGFFSTLFFSKVRQSHNFRLAMPFRTHIRIAVENPSDIDLHGYTEIQWESLPALPEDCGYLHVDFRQGAARIPDDVVELCRIDAAGSIVAHWLQIESDHPRCERGELLCEGNHEIRLDGDVEPTLESLGTEDYYGFSWGFIGTQSDHHVAILKADDKPEGGARIALLRCRDFDRIRFRKSCRIVLDYRQEYFSRLSANPLTARWNSGTVDFDMQYRSCCYYYRTR